MKTKPTRHKEENRFKFKPFSERVYEIKIDALNKVLHPNEQFSDAGQETYFYQCLQKWNFMNLSESYSTLRKEVQDIITLPQLLNKKEFVFEVLLKYLNQRNPLSLQSVLELIVALSKDLQNEFYPHFPTFLTAIIGLLKIKDAEQLEHIFTTLSYLFKSLWRYLVKNVDPIFDLLVPLLDDTYPVYINNFAAESFAFVIRKIREKDRQSFMKLVFGSLETRRNRVAGCGKLLFEALLNATTKLHSCTSYMLPLYLDSIRDESVDSKIVFEVLSHVFKQIASKIHPNDSDIFWTVIYQTFDTFENEKSTMTLMRLVQVVLDIRGGRLIKDPVTWVRKLAELMDKFDGEDVLEEIVNASVNTILGVEVHLNQETSSFLIVKLLDMKNRRLLLLAAEKLISLSSYEMLILPRLMKNKTVSSFDEVLLTFFAKFVMAKSPPCLSGVDFDHWKKCSLNFKPLSNYTDYLSKLLDDMDENFISEGVLKCFLVLPHLSSLQPEIIEKIKNHYIRLYETLIQNDSLASKEEKSRTNFGFLLATECLARILSPNEFHDFVNSISCEIGDPITLAEWYQDDVAALNAFDISLSCLKKSDFAKEHINQVVFDALHEKLFAKLSSPDPRVRGVISHLVSHFSNVESLHREKLTSDPKSPLELMYLAELEPATVHKYRDKLLHISALKFGSPSMNNLKSEYQDLPLRYLLGNLHVNFSLLWEPVSEIIASYANRECQKFWELFFGELESEDVKSGSNAGPKYQCEILENLKSRIWDSKAKTDRDNYKLLLWKCMATFASFCEKKNRDFVGVFIDFVETNFFRSDCDAVAHSCNIKKRLDKDFHNVYENFVDKDREMSCVELEEESIIENETTVEEESIIEDESIIEQPEKSSGKQVISDGDESFEELEKQQSSLLKMDFETSIQNLPTKGRQYKEKLLLTMLGIFGKFTNVRSLYREPEIRKIYLDFLSSKNSDIQKAALTCLCAYKEDFLLPYKDGLNNLIDEKNFKNELVRFRIDEEKHRPGILPILMRILHSKMTKRVGMRTGGKAGGLVRRKCILRFLGGTKEDEMMVFVQMAFKPFQRYLQLLSENDFRNKLSNLANDIKNSVDLENVVPPKRLQSAVNLLSIVIEHFGVKMAQKLLPLMLGLLVCIRSEIEGMMQRSEDILSGHLTTIKAIRQSSTSIVARFFEHFENYEWTESELDSIFDIFVFSNLNKLSVDGIHAPTPLLKLFVKWSENPRYFLLFIKHKENDKSMTPLPHVVKLLLGSKIHKSVIQAILGMFEKLLTLQDFEKQQQDSERMDIDEEKKATSLISVVKNKLEVEELMTEDVNLGSRILLPHVTNILKYIERRLNRSKGGMTRMELVILSRLTEFVKDPKTCDTLLKLIVPLLEKKVIQSEETTIQLFTTVINLIRYVDEPEIHLRSLQNLLASVSSVPARKLLIQLLSIIAENSNTEQREKYISYHSVLANLNAWDQRWIEQPDFQKRLDAFVKVEELLREDNVTLEFGVAVIYTCFFFLRTENDLALRDRSGQTLKTVGVFLARKYQHSPKDRKYLIEGAVLSMVRTGMRSENENLKLQSIAFLGHMARECPDVHLVLRDLNLLTNKEDPEVDFFENMQHLQLHRKVRALLKFCNVAKGLKEYPNTRTLTQFILPLASSYLCNEKFANKNSMIDAAIDTVAVVCRLLPWREYEFILRHYLGKLRLGIEHQRQVVRIVVAILDSFHFDISRFKQEEGSTEVEVKEDSCEEVVSEEKLDEILNEDENEEKIDETLYKDEQTVSDKPVIERCIMLSEQMSKKLVDRIYNVLLPQLHKTITARTKHEINHKVNKKKYNTDQEEEELMRVPIALAMVKLLQKLPDKMLNSNLRPIFTKICTFLKSRLDSVRRATREILQKIMITLGPNYLHHLLKEMAALLTRGYQMHVLSFTIHAVLTSLKPYFQSHHIRSNLSHILSVCKMDLFGPTAEEKEIAGIVKNVSEAKSTKSYDIYNILGEFTDMKSILDIVMPLKEVLAKTTSHKTLRKIIECLRNLGLGLADNKFIDISEIATFIFDVASESVPQLFIQKSEENLGQKKEADKFLTKVEDTFIIPPQPKNKMGVKVLAKRSKNANAHVLVEFGLRLFHILLKRDKFNDSQLLIKLDPFVPILANSLKSQHVKICTLALQCFNWLLKMNLPTLKTDVHGICQSIFGILHKYAVAGLSKGDNYDMVTAAFKTMSVLLRDVGDFTVTTDQLKVLLMYAEQDLYDGDKQASAFGMLKAIIHRKLVSPEVHSVMEKVAELSVISELDNVRKQARLVFYNYFFNYPLKKFIEKYLTFYCKQLAYELKPGRLSAIEMIFSVVSSFPEDVLAEHSDLLFFMVGVRLINDDDPECKKGCAQIIKEILTRVSHNKRSSLFEIVLLWSRDKAILHRTLAAQLCGIFVSVEQENFKTRLPDILPLLIVQFSPNYLGASDQEPGRFVRIKPEEEKPEDSLSENIKDPERLRDHNLFQVLQLLLKICANCGSFLKNQKYRDSITSCASYSQSLLAHAHLWVRLAATQFIGCVLASLDAEKLSKLLLNPENCDPDDGYIYSDPIETIRSLILDMVAQLHPDVESEDLFNQIVKNLIFISRHLKIQSNEEGRNVDLLWLVKRLRKSIHAETAQASKSISIREAIFKWMAGVISTVKVDSLRPILHHFVAPLVREMVSTEESNATLRRLAKEVSQMLKKRMSEEEYTQLISQAQQKLDKKKAERKTSYAHKFITDPELAAKRKIAKQQKKKQFRKRKMEEMKGKKTSRKRPRREVNLEENQ